MRTWIRLSVWRDLLGLCAVLVTVTGWARPMEVPPSWPWHGVVMDVVTNTPDDVRRVKQALNVNTIQLQLWSTQLAARDHLSGTEAWLRSLQWLDSMLDACRSEDVGAIVNASWFPIDITRGYDQTSPSFWNSSSDRAEVLNLLRGLSLHLRTRRAELVGYDIISEPVMVSMGRAMVPPGWDSFQRDIVKTIRANDRQRWIVVKPGPWGGPGGYSGYHLLPDKKLVYGFHMYLPHAFTHQGIQGWPYGVTYPGVIQGQYWDKAALENALAPVINFQKQYNIPVWVGEFSALRWAPGGETYLADLADIFDRHGWGWSYFNFGFWHGWNPDYNNVYLDPATMPDYASQWVGDTSPRWATLRKIFHVPPLPAATPAVGP